MADLDILLVRAPWAEKLVKGQKQWELRSRPVKKRGPIAVGQTKDHLILGRVTIVDCHLAAVRGRSGKLEPPADCTSDDWLGSNENLKRHCVDMEQLPKTWKKVYAWVLSSAYEYPVPIPYKHVPGCQTWLVTRKKPVSGPTSRAQCKKRPASSPVTRV